MTDSTLHSTVLRLAAELPQGDDTRRKLLVALNRDRAVAQQVKAMENSVSQVFKGYQGADEPSDIDWHRDGDAVAMGWVLNDRYPLDAEVGYDNDHLVIYAAGGEFVRAADAAKALKNRMSRMGTRKRAGHGLDREWLIESDVRMTPELMRATALFVRAVSKALSVWMQRNPTDSGDTIKDVMGNKGALVVYRTLSEEEGGLKEGGWDRYWDDTRELEGYLGSSLARPFREFQHALDEASGE